MKTGTFDVATGQFTDRDMTEAEEKDFNDCTAVCAAQHKEIEDAITKKATDQATATTKLKALGLTDDEITALINN